MTLPISNTVIVTFGNSLEEQAATKTLVTELDNPIVVSYGSLDYTLLKHRAYKSMVFVGHGSEQGIQYHHSLIPAKMIDHETKTNAAKNYYILSCNSASMLSDHRRNVKGFASAIDAEIGALIVSIYINADQRTGANFDKTFEKALALLSSKIDGESPYLPLATYLDPGSGGGGSGGSGGSTSYFSAAEKENFYRTLIVSVIFAVIGTVAFHYAGKFFARGASESKVVEASGKTLGKMFTTVIKELVKKGASAAGKIITAVFGGFMSLAKTLVSSVKDAWYIATHKMNAKEWAIFTALVLAEIALAFATGGSSLAVKISASVGVALVNVAIIGITDYKDSDGTPCKSIFQAISSWT
ncbi:MAG: hypothetical protein K9W43_07945 [Candidatus Thorarchaeota archaeon]|nr:hypothetical protein [Candidatus Thorarchaeota archaeon]